MGDKGRKYWLTVAYLVIATGFMIASYVLALLGKMTTEWGTLGMIYLPSVAFATIGFQASNAFVSGKALEHCEQPETAANATEKQQ